jgi:hypothetical protein
MKFVAHNSRTATRLLAGSPSGNRREMLNIIEAKIDIAIKLWVKDTKDKDFEQAVIALRKQILSIPELEELIKEATK